MRTRRTHFQLWKSVAAKHSLAFLSIFEGCWFTIVIYLAMLGEVGQLISLKLEEVADPA